MNKAAPRLLEYNYDTGHPFEDQRTKEMISTLLNVDLLCSPNFDESMLFTDPQTESLMNQTKNHFRNISQIMVFQVEIKLKETRTVSLVKSVKCGRKCK